MLKHRSIFGWAFLALYSAIAVLGEALHVLPGMGHSCTMLHHGGVACHFGFATAAAFPSDRPAFSAAGEARQFSCANDCPICQYFAQAKCFLEIDNFTSESLPSCAQHTTPPLHFFRHSLSAYQSRGPPADLWNS